MSKDKKLRKIVIDKLFYQNEHQMKESTRSNAPTESTPNEPKNFSKAIENFFRNFETQCAIIYEQVQLKGRRPLKRSLQDELSQLRKEEKIFKFKTQEFESSSIPISYPPKISSYLQRPESFSRIRLTDYNQQIISKQKRINRLSSQIQKIFKSKPISQNSVSSFDTKLSSIQKFKQSLGQLNPSIKFQKEKISHQKPKLPFIKQKQTDIYLTNSKNSINKFTPKNAPKKLQQKPFKVQRIKRIQSLKNLNENGIRKYSYKRQF